MNAGMDPGRIASDSADAGRIWKRVWPISGLCLMTVVTHAAEGDQRFHGGAYDGWDSSAMTVSASLSAPDANNPPSVHAGQDLTITLPTSSVSLSGTASDDGRPNPSSTLSVTWSMVSGPGAVGFGNANVAQTTATFSVVGSYVLRLTADDGGLATIDEVTITVDQAAAVDPGKAKKSQPGCGLGSGLALMFAGLWSGLLGARRSHERRRSA